MSVSASRKAHDTGIVIATFGGFPTLPGLGIFLLKALPKLNRWLSGVPLDSSEKESLRGAFRSYRITLTRPILEPEQGNVLGAKSTITDFTDSATFYPKSRGSIQSQKPRLDTGRRSPLPVFDLMMKSKTGEEARLGAKLSHQLADKLAGELSAIIGPSKPLP